MTTTVATIKLDKEIKDRLKKQGEAQTAHRTGSWLMQSKTMYSVKKSVKYSAVK